MDLASLHGKYTVLFFYPGDFGSLVLADMMGLQEAASELMEDDVNMLAISTDTVESHKAFAELRQEEGGLQGLHCILVEDKTGNICRKYKVYDAATHQAFPTYIIMDDEGEVVASLSNDHNLGGNPEEVVRIIKACRMCDEEGAWSKLKGTPSDWQPGMELVTGMVEEVANEEGEQTEVVETEEFPVSEDEKVDTGEAVEEENDKASSSSASGTDGNEESKWWKFWSN